MPKPDFRRRETRPPIPDNRADRGRASGSIQARLLKLFAAVLGAISFFVFLFFPATIGNEATKGLDERAHAIAQMAAFSVGPAVYFDDEQAMVESLGGALEDADIDQIRVLARDGTTLTSLVDPDAGSDDPGAGARAGDFYEVYVPVYFSEEEIGQVRLLVSRRALRARVAAARRLVGLISLAIFIAGLLSVLAISHKVTRPLSEVSAIARRIANGELDVRASRAYEGEVAELAGAFNHMMDEVESAHVEAQRAKTHLEQVLDNLPAEVSMFDVGHRYLYVNPAGMPDSTLRARAIGQSPVAFRMGTGASTESAMETEEALRTCLGEQRAVRLEQESKDGEGGVRHFLRSYNPIVDHSGEVTNVIACGIEISDLREAESALVEAQQQLAQAQKMESVGRLAGGIAHDFNNLLVSITGHVDLMLLDLSPDNKIRPGLKEMRNAADQARSLTRQLLTFSRKEIRQPRVLDLNEVIRHSEKMLSRSIGDEIDLSMKLSDELGSVEVDPGQIDQVIVNLVLNARDAMKTGGAITIRSQAIEFDSPMTDEFGVLPPGRYVVLSVADTGVGMDKATRAKIFDPFFTTKGPGEGTGLGLATAHGIITQSDGFLRVYSEPGMGATFKIFLPVVDAGPEALFPDRPQEALEAGAETVLVVEDQETVRSMVRAILERCGYQVILADTPFEALEVAEARPDEIDLLLTDVVMPGMQGPEVVSRVTSLIPGIPVLYMSGYTDDQLVHEGTLDDGVNLVEKPFSAFSLSSMVRAVLDGAGTTGAGASSTSLTAESPSAAAQAQVFEMEQQPQTVLDERVLEDLRSLGESGGVSALDQVVEAFLESAPESFREVRQAAKDGDGEALRKVCHALKSNSAIVGAVHLSSLLKEAEIAARTGEIERAGRLVDPILSEYANVEAALSTVVQGVSHVS